MMSWHVGILLAALLSRVFPVEGSYEFAVLEVFIGNGCTGHPVRAPAVLDSAWDPSASGAANIMFQQLLTGGGTAAASAETGTGFLAGATPAWTNSGTGYNPTSGTSCGKRADNKLGVAAASVYYTFKNGECGGLDEVAAAVNMGVATSSPPDIDKVDFFPNFGPGVLMASNFYPTGHLTERGHNQIAPTGTAGSALAINSGYSARLTCLQGASTTTTYLEMDYVLLQGQKAVGQTCPGLHLDENAFSTTLENDDGFMIPVNLASSSLDEAADFRAYWNAVHDSFNSAADSLPLAANSVTFTQCHSNVNKLGVKYTTNTGTGTPAAAGYGSGRCYTRHATTALAMTCSPGMLVVAVDYGYSARAAQIGVVGTGDAYPLTGNNCEGKPVAMHKIWRGQPSGGSLLSLLNRAINTSGSPAVFTAAYLRQRCSPGNDIRLRVTTSTASPKTGWVNSNTISALGSADFKNGECYWGVRYYCFASAADIEHAVKQVAEFTASQATSSPNPAPAPVTVAPSTTTAAEDDDTLYLVLGLAGTILSVCIIFMMNQGGQGQGGGPPTGGGGFGVGVAGGGSGRGESGGSDAWYYADRRGRKQGPFSTERMERWWARGMLVPETWVKPPRSWNMNVQGHGGFAPIKQLFPDLSRAFQR